MMAGSLISIVSRPPSISRVTCAEPSLRSSFDANVPCDQPRRAESIWPV